MKNWKKKFKELFPEGLGEEGNGCNDPDCCGEAGFIDRTDDIINFIEKLLKNSHEKTKKEKYLKTQKRSRRSL